jgi:hypothetical protein
VNDDEELLDRVRARLGALDLSIEDLTAEALAAARARVADILTRTLTAELLERALSELGTSQPARPPVTAPWARATDDGSTVVYLFGITTGADQEDLTGLPRLPGGAPVRLVAEDELQLLVTDVAPHTLSQLSDAAADDLDLLAAVAAAHDEVLVTIARHRPVLPMRLGTAAPDEAGARSVLRHDAEVFRAELRRLTGHAEWAVTVRMMSDQRAPATEREEPTPSSGRGYLEARRQDLSARERRRRAADDLASTIHRRLTEHVSEAQIVSPRLVGDATRPILHGVYLVRDDEVEAFRAEVDRVTQELGQAVVEVSGPLPPYHFVAIEALGGSGP